MGCVSRNQVLMGHDGCQVLHQPAGLHIAPLVQLMRCGQQLE